MAVLIIMETSESLEEGLIPNPPLLERPMITNEIGNGSGMYESDPSTTPAVVFSTLVAICSSFTYGCAVGYSSPAESGMRADLGLSVTEYSVFGSVLTFGGIIGSLVNGKIADPTGRRGAMWLSELFCIVGWLAIAFSKDAWSLYLGRCSIGIGLALIAYVIPIYIAEITPKNIRGAFTATSQFLIVSGMSVMYLVGTIVSWRALALIAAVPCLLQVVGLFFIPESPRWLAKIGKEKELETTLQCLRGKTADISMESADIRDCTQTFEKDSKAGIFDLFQRRYAYSLSVGVGLMVMQPFVGSAAIAYYASYIIAAADLSTDIGSISMAIIQLPAIGASVLLTDRFGRRPLLLASTIWMGLSLTIIALAFGLQDTHLWNEATPVLVYVGIMGFSIAFALGMAGLPSVIMAEIFPINIKGSAGSLVILLHNCSNWIVTYTFHFTMEWSRTGTFSIFWVICAAAVLFVAFLVPETKGRHSKKFKYQLQSINKFYNRTPHLSKTMHI
ncbi:sugar transporter ERD6-like 10 [Citrus clementina]|uniref:sugar transporter ERD6-like 10 n=1 Tax=Citrus clementina TaxID=85681 RepID=UPI000CED4BDB|nr:sugar transporter ERD6-like 10 [Citrus x clementina]